MFPKGTALWRILCDCSGNWIIWRVWSDEEYLDEKDVRAVLQRGFYAGLMSGLKWPIFRIYYTAEQYKKGTEHIQWRLYVGIGAVLQKDEEGWGQIIQLSEGRVRRTGGAEKGDVLWKAVLDGKEVTRKETADIAAMIRKVDKDSVTPTIQRAEQKETSDIKVEIRDVEIQTVSREMLDDETGLHPHFRIFMKLPAISTKAFERPSDDKGNEEISSRSQEIIQAREIRMQSAMLRQILPEGLIVCTEDTKMEKEEEKCDVAKKWTPTCLLQCW